MSVWKEELEEDQEEESSAMCCVPRYICKKLGPFAPGGNQFGIGK